MTDITEAGGAYLGYDGKAHRVPDDARNYFTENNAWTYIWDVQHDLDGLLALFGSKAAMSAKLDRMLAKDVPCKWKFTSQMPDGCTGLMGSFTMANEPAFHIPYLYNFFGEWQ